MDRDFMILIWVQHTYSELSGETQTIITLDDLIPVDILIKAIHRIYHVDVAPSHNCMLQSTLSTQELFENSTLDGKIEVIDIIRSLTTTHEAMSFMLPDGIDINFILFSPNYQDDNYLYRSKYVDIELDSNQILRYVTQPDNMGNTLVGGQVDEVIILECKVR